MNARKDDSERLGELEPLLLDVVTWMSLLDRIVDDITEQPRNPRVDADDRSTGHLLKVTAMLKRSIDELYALYHGMGEEEASAAA
jgi:hypothetical protein